MWLPTQLQDISTITEELLTVEDKDELEVGAFSKGFLTCFLGDVFGQDLWAWEIYPKNNRKSPEFVPNFGWCNEPFNWSSIETTNFGWYSTWGNVAGFP